MIEYFHEMYLMAIAGEKQGILFWICLYALVIVGYSVIFQFRVRKWPSTNGILIQSGIKKFGYTEWSTSDKQYRVDALYRYTVEGEEYQGKRISPWLIIVSHNARFVLRKQLAGIKRNPGDTVEVIYNPKNPHKSYLIRPSVVGLLVTICITIAPMMLYLQSYH